MDNKDQLSFVKKIDESVSTDYVADLKSGIFNLFVSLYQHLSIEIGPKNSILYCTEYLSEIIKTFTDIIEQQKTQE